jgi:hypothetical protein
MIIAIVAAFVFGWFTHRLAHEETRHLPPRDEPNIWQHYRRHGSDEL